MELSALDIISETRLVVMIMIVILSVVQAQANLASTAFFAPLPRDHNLDHHQHSFDHDHKFKLPDNLEHI